MTTHRRLRALLAAAAVGAIALPGASFASAGTTSTPTETVLSIPDGAVSYTDYSPSVGKIGPFLPGTDVGFAAWWMTTNGTLIDSKGGILGPTRKTAVLGAAFNWPAAATIAGENVTTTASLGAFAIWSRNAKITSLNQDFTTAGVTTSSAATGHVALVTGLWSNGTMVVDSWNGNTHSTQLVPAKSVGLSFVKPLPSGSLTQYALTIKNTSSAAMTILAKQPLLSYPEIGTGRVTIPAGQSATLSLVPYVVLTAFPDDATKYTYSYLTPTYTLTNGTRAVGAVTATSGGAKTLILSK